MNISHLSHLISKSINDNTDWSTFDSRTADNYPIDFRFNYVQIEHDSELWNSLSDVISSEIIHARIHRQDPSHYIEEHSDDAFPGCDVVIFRLDANHEPRLHINQQPINETQYQGIVIPEGVRHSIELGEHDRYSLVAWYSSS